MDTFLNHYAYLQRGQTALYLATLQRHTELVKLLADAKADLEVEHVH